MRERRWGRGRSDLSVGAVVVGVAIVTIAGLAPSMGGYHAYVLALVVIQVIAVLSLNVLMGYAGQVSLGQAALLGMGAYGAGQLAAWGVPFPLTIVGAVGLTAGAAAIVGLPALRIRGLQLAVTTLAFGIAAELLLFARPWDPRASMGVSLPRPAALTDDRHFLLVTLAALVLVLVLDRGVRRSRLGRAFLAVRDREDIAAARGVPIGLTKLTAYAVSGIYAGIAGTLYGYLLERVTPAPFEVWDSLGYVAAAVIGGLGSWTGAIVAAAALTALPELLRPAALYAPLTGALLLAIVPALRPEGLGWLLDRRVRRAARPAVTTQDATLAPPRRPLPLSVPLRTILTIEDVHVSFGGLHVLEGVDLEVRRGQIVGLIGPNGAGKSTLFNCVSGFVTPTRGRIAYQRRDLLALPVHGRAGVGIGRTFQHTGLCPELTALDNVLIAQHTMATYGAAAALAWAPHVDRAESRLAGRAQLALEAVGLPDAAHQRVGDLPHLEQRLVEIAGAVAAGPRLLLLDEPAAGVRPEEAHDLGRRLRALRDHLDLTMIVIEHHVPLVADLCDHVVVLADGRVLTAGTAAEVQAHPRVQAVYLGTEPADHATAPTLEVASNG